MAASKSSKARSTCTSAAKSAERMSGLRLRGLAQRIRRPSDALGHHRTARHRIRTKLGTALDRFDQASRINTVLRQRWLIKAVLHATTGRGPPSTSRSICGGSRCKRDRPGTTSSRMRAARHD